MASNSSLKSRFHHRVATAWMPPQATLLAKNSLKRNKKKSVLLISRNRVNLSTLSKWPRSSSKSTNRNKTSSLLQVKHRRLRARSSQLLPPKSLKCPRFCLDSMSLCKVSMTCSPWIIFSHSLCSLQGCTDWCHLRPWPWLHVRSTNRPKRLPQRSLVTRCQESKRNLLAYRVSTARLLYWEIYARCSECRLCWIQRRNCFSATRSSRLSPAWTSKMPRRQLLMLKKARKSRLKHNRRLQRRMSSMTTATCHSRQRISASSTPMWRHYSTSIPMWEHASHKRLSCKEKINLIVLSSCTLRLSTCSCRCKAQWTKKWHSASRTSQRSSSSSATICKPSSSRPKLCFFRRES